METEFAINEFLGPSCEELKCVLKHLYSDFIVKEISEDGTVCEVCTVANLDDKEGLCDKQDTILIDFDCLKPLIISNENLEQLDALAKAENNKNITLPVQELSKEERTKIHIWIRQRYKNRLQSRTESGSIVVSLSGNDRKRRQWPADRPDFLHFTLSKENKDSQYALSLVAKFLGTKVANLGTRGTKDRRAVTAQRVSVYRYDSDRVKQLNTQLRGIRLSDFSYQCKPCLLGNLWGNRFQIVLRNLSLPDIEVKRRVEEITNLGFINYFGTQRFGSCGINTADIGLSIIKKQWKDAVQMILKPRSVDGCLANALRVWEETGDAKLAVNQLSGSQAFASIESRILNGLTKGDYRAALLGLSRSTRSLYVHAFQSLLWNKVASRRIKEYSTSLLEGDVDMEGNEVKMDDDITKVALPLPSSVMTLPKNITGNWYTELMEQYDIKPEMFAALERDYAVASVLRPLIVKPKDVEFEFRTYDNPDAKLQPDLDGQFDGQPGQEGGRKALLIKFSLPAGSYATVALRQLTRCDMGKLSQKLSSLSDCPSVS